MADLSNVNARLHLLPLRKIILVTELVRLARLVLWVGRVTNQSDLALRISEPIIARADRVGAAD